MIDSIIGITSNPSDPAERFVMGAPTSPIPILLLDGSAGHLVLMANSSFLNMVDQPESQIVGQPLANALGTLMSDQNIEYVTKRLSLNKPATWEIETSGAEGGMASISLFDCPVRVAASPQPGHILSFHVPKEHVEHSRPTVEEMRALYMHAPGFIATTEGPDHRLTFANESFKRYVGKRQLEGLTVTEAMPETVEQGFIELLDNVYATGIPYHGKSVPYAFPDADTGEVTRHYGDFVYVPVRDANSNIVGLFCEGYDITRQKEAEAVVATLNTKVAHASRVNAMGTMATTMAHELNQPLTAILNYTVGALRLLDRPDADMDAIQQAMLSVQESGERAASIIRTLRNLTDRRVRANVEFQLSPFIAEALNLVRNGCSVDTQLHANIHTDLSVTADRVQIQQVIINLLRNGCDAVSGMKEQLVSVAAEATDDEVVISVRDSGPGLAADTAQDIFTWMDSSKESGMGLGLSICRTIVESHGGRIWLEDSGKDGTEFRFTLPLNPLELP